MLAYSRLVRRHCLLDFSSIQRGREEVDGQAKNWFVFWVLGFSLYLGEDRLSNSYHWVLISGVSDHCRLSFSHSIKIILFSVIISIIVELSFCDPIRGHL